MATEFRKGSMGAAEEKNKIYWYYGTGAVYLFIFLLLVAIPNYLRDLVRQADGIANFFGIAILIFSGYLFYTAIKNGSFKRGIIAFVLIAVAIFVSCGFQFSLFGIAERP